MSDVYLLELTHPQQPLQRVMIESNGPTAAKRTYTDLVAKVRKVDTSEALDLAADGVPFLREPPTAAPAPTSQS